MLELPTFLKQMFSHAPKFMFSLPGQEKPSPLERGGGGCAECNLGKKRV